MFGSAHEKEILTKEDIYTALPVNIQMSEHYTSDQEGDDDDEEDEVIDFAYDSESDDEQEETGGGEENICHSTDDDINFESLFTKTRSGRIARSWKISEYCQPN